MAQQEEKDKKRPLEKRRKTGIMAHRKKKIKIRLLEKRRKTGIMAAAGETRIKGDSSKCVEAYTSEHLP